MKSVENLRGQLVGGRFVLEEWLTSGSFGDIYRGRQSALGREVAVKLLRNEWCDEPRVVERFRAEAAAAATVEHSNVIEVYDFGEARGRPYLAMELLRGCSLRQRLDSGLRPTTRVAVDLCKDVLDGLAAAHAAGVVHGDVKPSNIILHPRDGREIVKLIDFGAASPTVGATIDVEDLVGTPGYLAPELVEGRSGAAADLYAVGAVLFELLFGSTPFPGNTVTEVLMRQLEAPLVRPARGHCSEELWRVVKRALARNPEARFPNAQVMRRELAAALRPTPTANSAAEELVTKLRVAIGDELRDGELDRVVSYYLDLADLLAGLGHSWRALGELEEAADVITGGEGLYGERGPAKVWAVAVRMAELERDVAPERALSHARAGLRRALLAGEREGAGRARDLIAELVDGRESQVS